MDWIEARPSDGWGDRVAEEVAKVIREEHFGERSRARRIVREVLCDRIQEAVDFARSEEADTDPHGSVWIPSRVLQASLGELGQRLSTMFPEKSYGALWRALAGAAGPAIFGELGEPAGASDVAWDEMLSLIEDTSASGDPSVQALLVLLRGETTTDAPTRAHKAIAAAFRRCVYRHWRQDQMVQEV